MKRQMALARILLLGVLAMAGCASPKAPPPTSAPSFPAGAFVNGDWAWEFKADGSFNSSGPLGSETGTYTVNGSQVIITCQCCGDAKGTYAWAFDGNTLQFTAIDDSCSNRKGVVNASTWSKKP